MRAGSTFKSRESDAAETFERGDELTGPALVHLRDD